MGGALGGRHGVDGTTKTGKAQWVDLPDQLCSELSAHLSTRDHGPGARVWTGERCGPLAHHWFYQHRFKPVVVDLSENGHLPVVHTVGKDGEPETFTLPFTI